jgi:hypothetical protein
MFKADGGLYPAKPNGTDQELKEIESKVWE